MGPDARAWLTPVLLSGAAGGCILGTFVLNRAVFGPGPGLVYFWAAGMAVVWLLGRGAGASGASDRGRLSAGRAAASAGIGMGVVIGVSLIGTWMLYPASGNHPVAMSVGAIAFAIGYSMGYM